jgi:hypothetical protein
MVGSCVIRVLVYVIWTEKSLEVLLLRDCVIFSNDTTTWDPFPSLI